ncbi:hypothetical protein M1247_01015 [Mycobacterium sp. 21AC1]|uniref:hypothetical protein n=1 Tax=[Mycobacterium] appelbergii TaxID=2939269 RepID=UPI002939373F|nr:hypothetical protein [Mycobacterium sp. 21AC1]MDV3123482.1 hypothetical protein [Mycobacterium sp. 21AC1]
MTDAIQAGLLAMAVARFAGGAASRITPSGTARFFGATAERSPEFDYVVRVCGIRAVALGLGYLSTTGDARRRWQQLALLCDISDTAAGIGDLARGQIPRSTALGATLRAGVFAVIGAAQIIRDRGQILPPGNIVLTA